MAAKRFVIEPTDHRLGNIQAPIVLLEYGDYQCEFCKAALPVVKKLRRHFGKQLVFIFRNFPLTTEHPNAFAKAVAAEAAAKQRKFWRMHSVLFIEKSILTAAKKAGVDLKKFLLAMRSDELQKKVDADISSGIHIGVNGTPSFFVNGKRYNGEHNYIAMSEYIQHVLDRRK